MRLLLILRLTDKQYEFVSQEQDEVVVCGVGQPTTVFLSCFAGEFSVEPSERYLSSQSGVIDQSGVIESMNSQD